MKIFQIRTLLLALPMALAACGGGGSNSTTPKATVSSVVVFGDSLQDSGTFGLKFTVNGPNAKVWPELITSLYSAKPQCPHYTFSAGPFPVAASDTTCTNYAVGNSRINSVPVDMSGNSPFSVLQQLRDAGVGRTYTEANLLMVDGGGNDAADLTEALLTSAPGNGYAPFIDLLATVGIAVDPTMLATPGYIAGQGVLYMQTLANNLDATLQAEALGKGAKRVVIINIPDILKTPDFTAVLAANPSAQAAVPLVEAWIQAYNSRLAALYAADSRVVVVDFYTEFNNQIANPAQFGLSNVTDPVCAYNADTLTNFAQCTEDTVSAEVGKTSPNWWKTYAFSDGFHPTPYAHQLVSQLISRSLARAGWL